MPFFSTRKPEEEVVEEQPAPQLEKKQSSGGGLFGSLHHHHHHHDRRSPSPTSTNRTASYRTASSSASSSAHPDQQPSSRHRSVLSRFGGGCGSHGAELDPSIQAARERVMGAEQAESEADRALASARVRVREAREEVKRLEIEAAEEARRAKIKQYHAREVSKRGKQLGRRSPPHTSLSLSLSLCLYSSFLSHSSLLATIDRTTPLPRWSMDIYTNKNTPRRP